MSIKCQLLSLKTEQINALTFIGWCVSLLSACRRDAFFRRHLRIIFSFPCKHNLGLASQWKMLLQQILLLDAKVTFSLLFAAFLASMYWYYRQRIAPYLKFPVYFLFMDFKLLYACLTGKGPDGTPFTQCKLFYLNFH